MVGNHPHRSHQQLNILAANLTDKASSREMVQRSACWPSSPEGFLARGGQGAPWLAAHLSGFQSPGNGRKTKFRVRRREFNKFQLYHLY